MSGTPIIPADTKIRALAAVPNKVSSAPVEVENFAALTIPSTRYRENLRKQQAELNTIPKSVVQDLEADYRHATQHKFPEPKWSALDKSLRLALSQPQRLNKEHLERLNEYTSFKKDWANRINSDPEWQAKLGEFKVTAGLPNHPNFAMQFGQHEPRQLSAREGQVLSFIERTYDQRFDQAGYSFDPRRQKVIHTSRNEKGQLVRRDVSDREIDEFKAAFAERENLKLDKSETPDVRVRLYAGVSGSPRLGYDASGLLRENRRILETKPLPGTIDRQLPNPNQPIEASPPPTTKPPSPTESKPPTITNEQLPIQKPSQIDSEIPITSENPTIRTPITKSSESNILDIKPQSSPNNLRSHAIYAPSELAPNNKSFVTMLRSFVDFLNRWTKTLEERNFAVSEPSSMPKSKSPINRD